MKLYTYFRSSAAFRVRIALNLKNLPYEPAAVNLLAGAQHGAEFRRVHPQGLVPALEDGGRLYAQSLAIIEYLDERHPEPPLLPGSPEARARVRALALAIACDIHPLNNLRVLRYLERDLDCDKDRRLAWYRHWVAEGFGALEAMLADSAAGCYCHGTGPTLADVVLVPQVFNAQRYGCDLAPYPRIRAIHGACMALPAFRNAAPEHQPDALAEHPS